MIEYKTFSVTNRFDNFSFLSSVNNHEEYLLFIKSVVYEMYNAGQGYWEPFDDGIIISLLQYNRIIKIY